MPPRFALISRAAVRHPIETDGEAKREPTVSKSGPALPGRFLHTKNRPENSEPVFFNNPYRQSLSRVLIRLKAWFQSRISIRPVRALRRQSSRSRRCWRP